MRFNILDSESEEMEFLGLPFFGLQEHVADFSWIFWTTGRREKFECDGE
jgi:hypothetical protein